jgi:acyl dehydratase
MNEQEAVRDRPTVYGRITEEGLEQLRGWMNIEHPIEEPFIRYVNADSIRHVARAIGDMNPLWIDPAHARTSRFGRLAARPAFLYGVSWGAWDRRRGEGSPGVHGLHSRDCWTYYRPILDGDEIHAVKMLVGLEEKSGTYAGRSVIQTGLFRYFNQRDELVAKCLMSAFRVERHAGDAAMTDAKCQAGGVLSGLRVLDISHQYSGAFTASLLADLGASVVSIEHPAGSPIRTMLPKRGGESLHPANRRTPP